MCSFVFNLRSLPVTSRNFFVSHLTKRRGKEERKKEGGKSREREKHGKGKKKEEVKRFIKGKGFDRKDVEGSAGRFA